MLLVLDKEKQAKLQFRPGDAVLIVLSLLCLILPMSNFSAVQLSRDQINVTLENQPSATNGNMPFSSHLTLYG